MKKDLFLEEARLGPRNPVLVEYDEIPHLTGIRRRFRWYAHVDLAHVVMLVEEQILDATRGARLLEGLLELLELGAAHFPWDPRSGSYLVQVEHYLEQRLGEDVGGRLQTGRSRNDQEGAVERLYLRDLLLEVMGDLLALTRQLTMLARDHVDTVMPGYTHLQHAQPWSFGHFLMRHASGLERDLQRLSGAYARTNLSALGGAAMAGTSWAVLRRRTADLLGHEGLVVNACDAGVFARDHVEEDVAVLALLMSNLGRLATDLYVFHSWEFGFVQVEDGLAGTSSIMPQKKNPHALERVKALAGQAIGWLPGVAGCQRGVLSTDLDLAFGDDVVTPPAEGCRAGLRLLTEVTRTLIVDRERMAERAGAFWSTTSHLADELVRRFDLPFRTAHHVVARFVRDSLAVGHRPAEASADLLDRAARDLVGRDLRLGDAELRQALGASGFLHTRASEGSVNPLHVQAHIDAMDRALEGHGRWHAERQVQVRQATEALEQRARTLASAARSTS
ncbi:MAG: argininosuccinate lyase [Candidatus Rokuibacteriota bacterium]|nr:MAG: argininosuccinate lyase [Candidatus Rokubacteria bacterium]